VLRLGKNELELPHKAWVRSLCRAFNSPVAAPKEEDQEARCHSLSCIALLTWEKCTKSGLSFQEKQLSRSPPSQAGGSVCPDLQSLPVTLTKADQGRRALSALGEPERVSLLYLLTLI
jgi:hypothetical protein